jgi:hypothetical protein
MRLTCKHLQKISQIFLELRIVQVTGRQKKNQRSVSTPKLPGLSGQWASAATLLLLKEKWKKLSVKTLCTLLGSQLSCCPRQRWVHRARPGRWGRPGGGTLSPALGTCSCHLTMHRASVSARFFCPRPLGSWRRHCAQRSLNNVVTHE